MGARMRYQRVPASTQKVSQPFGMKELGACMPKTLCTM